MPQGGGLSVHLTLRNDPAEIGTLASAVTSFLARHGLPPRFAHDVNLALEEVVGNVIFYAWDDGLEHRFEVMLEMDGSTLRARVEDDGKPFDPLAAPLPDLDSPLEERTEGGLGIFLARRYMDDVAYERAGERNVLVLKKSAPAQPV